MSAGIRTRTAGMLTAFVVVALAVGFVIWRIVTPTYDDVVRDCVAALDRRPIGDNSKPGVCRGVKKDDYLVISVDSVMRREGWVDDNGNVDMSKILEDSE